MKKAVLMVIMLGIATAFAGCSGGGNVTGAYDDPDSVTMMDDKFSDTDFKLIADKMVGSLMKYLAENEKGKKPVIMVERLINKTSEHIDTEMITDEITTGILQSGKARLLNKSLRDARLKELGYNESGKVDPATMKKVGKEVGADYMLDGTMYSMEKPSGNKKLVYYYVNINITNLEDGTIAWRDKTEIKKRFKKSGNF